MFEEIRDIIAEQLSIDDLDELTFRYFSER